MKIIKNIKGNTILIVLVAIFVLLSIVLYLNKIIINEVKISRAKLNSKISHYAAESGIERTLYYIRKENYSLNSIVNNTTFNTENLDNNSSYKVYSDFQHSNEIDIPSIQSGDNYSLDISDYINDIKSFTISWESSGFDLTTISIAKRNKKNKFTSYEFFGIYNSYFSSPLTENININGSGNSNYIFEISPMLSEINNATITFYSGSNGTGNIVSIISSQNQRIKSIGNRLDSNNSVVSDFLINSEY